MIKIVEGDLLDATEDIIGHQVNCMGKMNSGVAKQIREKYPKAYEYYMYSHHNFLNLLSECLIVKVGENKYVANLYGQFGYGYDGKKYTDETALAKALNTLKIKARSYGKTVALPYKIGSDRGGANWSDVYEIIENVFDDYEVTLYKLNKKE